MQREKKEIKSGNSWKESNALYSICQDFGLRVIYENAVQTVYGLDNENSNSRMMVYRLYPGVDIFLYDFKDRYTWTGQWKDDINIYQISYCHDGVYQAELIKNKYSYASPGNIMFLNSCKKSLGSKMMTDVMQGFHILIFPEFLNREILNDWQDQFELDLFLILDFFKEIKKVKVIPCGAGLLHVAEDLYELIYNSEIGLVRLKLLEFFHLIIKEDFKIENVNRVFSKEQIEKTKIIKELIEMNLSKHYTIKELCENYDISTTIFKECFKQIFQYPPYEFLRIARMNKAAEYLKNSHKSIIDVSKLLGYENPSNFTRTFKEIYGVLPKEYRNKNV